jgi:hypothetical protein
MTQEQVVREETKEPTKQERPKEVAHDETPAIVADHKYSSRGEWWDLCRYCGLAEAAHAESEVQYYSDDDPDY